MKKAQRKAGPGGGYENEKRDRACSSEVTGLAFPAAAHRPQKSEAQKWPLVRLNEVAG